MSGSKRKFGALADLRRPEAVAPELPVSEPPVSEPSIREPPMPVAPAPDAGRAKRPLGKRSDPEWKLYSHFLKKKTQREAAALLLAEGEDGPDLSDVLQRLLESWIAEQKRT